MVKENQPISQQTEVVFKSVDSAGGLTLKNLQNRGGANAFTDLEFKCKNGFIRAHVAIVAPKSAIIDKQNKEKNQVTAQGELVNDQQEFTVQEVTPAVLLLYVGDILMFPEDKSSFNKVLQRLEVSPPANDPSLSNVERSENNSKYRLRCILHETGQNREVFVRANETVEAIPTGVN